MFLALTPPPGRLMMILSLGVLLSVSQLGAAKKCSRNKCCKPGFTGSLCQFQRDPEKYFNKISFAIDRLDPLLNKQSIKRSEIMDVSKCFNRLIGDAEKLLSRDQKKQARKFSKLRNRLWSILQNSTIDELGQRIGSISSNKLACEPTMIHMCGPTMEILVNDSDFRNLTTYDVKVKQFMSRKIVFANIKKMGMEIRLPRRILKRVFPNHDHIFDDDLVRSSRLPRGAKNYIKAFTCKGKNCNGHKKIRTIREMMEVIGPILNTTICGDGTKDEGATTSATVDENYCSVEEALVLAVYVNEIHKSFNKGPYYAFQMFLWEDDADELAVLKDFLRSRKLLD